MILRDIARAGIAGLLVGLVVAGLGGRIVMRLAAVAVPAARGTATANGNRIGEVTFGGTIEVVIIGALFAGVFAATIWVAVSPWMPRAPRRRALAAVPLAIGLGSFGLVRGDNVDFIVLRHDPVIVALLVGLVGLVGLAMAAVDAGLDRILPRARSVTDPMGIVYGLVAVPGLLFVPGVVATYLVGDGRPAGVPLLIAGAATIRWWYLRSRGAERPPDSLQQLGRGGVVGAAVVGLLFGLPEIAGALDLA